MPKNVRKRTRRMKPRIDAGDLKWDGDKVDFTYLDSNPFWRGGEDERFLDLGQITMVAGPTMANDSARHWLAMAAAASVLNGSDTATVAVITDRDNRSVRGDLRAAGFDTPDNRQTARFHHWQPRSSWWRDGLGPSRARDRYESDMHAHNHDLIIVHEPALADLEHWEWLLSNGPDKTSQPALLIVTDDLDVDDAWTLTVNHDSSFEFAARLTRDDEELSLVVTTNSSGNRKIILNTLR